ncbi:zinc transporter [Paroceanicella profunda]|uniref:High-affinity zinc uptake system protein ZnuA n=1 Tax=Paroceanicella profunda TaxID=2579971 RepID=A0A5B8FSW8_9RHOB|nr:zinc ABC transporter substrate-binding protein [Paroceanicella profunda]QDL91465.1 zinc transporter [Paroceanicella profunda]
MRKLFPGTLLTSMLLAGAAAAEPPSVATDIPPVQSLVARVMQGVGTPDLIIRPGASPHDYALRPSEAAALQRADIVFWIGEDLTPWLEGPISELAAGAESVQLLETPGTTELTFRGGATFEPHSHSGEEAHGDDHDAHSEERGHDEHDHHGHHDPHAWLDPENARVWLDVIAGRLSALDPEHAATYAANATAGRAELESLSQDINAQLAGLRDRPFIVFHDAYQYFENRFGLAAAGAITLGDATAPGAARIAEIRDKVAALGVTCAFSEPQFNPGLLRTVFQGETTKTGVLDPLGSDIPTGPGLYPQLLRHLANGLSDCLTDD